MSGYSKPTAYQQNMKKTSWLKIFSFIAVSLTPVMNQLTNISTNFVDIRNRLNSVYSGALGKLIRD
jgi:hypothetical protein